MPVVPRVVNDVSNATDINHESHFRLSKFRRVR